MKEAGHLLKHWMIYDYEPEKNHSIFISLEFEYPEKISSKKTHIVQVLVCDNQYADELQSYLNNQVKYKGCVSIQRKLPKQISSAEAKLLTSAKAVVMTSLSVSMAN